MIQGTDNEVLGWQGPCLLAPELLEQRILQYDVAAFDLVGAAEALLGANDLGNLHTAPIRPPGETAPALRRGQIQARMGAQVSKAERKAARTHAWRFERTDEYRRFMETYRRFVLEFVQPQIYDGAPLLYQRKPILRVVMPGSVPPTKRHCDADYYHDANEINFWVPLTRVWGSNTLWSESAPGARDFAPFEARPGEAVRFYGNRCEHYTQENDTDGTRVSIDFRVIPRHLFVPPTEVAATKSRHELNPGHSKRGYYAVSERAAPEEVARRRRAWREESALGQPAPRALRRAIAAATPAPLDVGRRRARPARQVS